MKKEEDLIYLRKYDEHCKLQLNSKILIIVKSKVKCVKRFKYHSMREFVCGCMHAEIYPTLELIQVVIFYD